MTDLPKIFPTCPVCRSCKTTCIEARGWKLPMLFCGMCGHMWQTEAPPQKKRGSIFEIPPDD